VHQARIVKIANRDVLQFELVLGADIEMVDLQRAVRLPEKCREGILQQQATNHSEGWKQEQDSSLLVLR